MTHPPSLRHVEVPAPYRVHFVLCPAAGAWCRSGCVRSFTRLEDAERFATDVLGRTPALVDPGADRLAEVRCVHDGDEVVVRRMS